MPSTASRSASATSRPISTAASPSSWPRRRKRARSTTRCRQEDQQILLEALRSLGALDKDFRYRAGEDSAAHRGYAKHPGGGLGAEPIDGDPIGLHDILTSRLWRGLQSFLLYDFQTTMFQPVGGMGRIGEAFARQIPDRIRYGAKVIAIRQNETGVTVAFEDLAGRRDHARRPGPTGACARFRSAS